MLLEDDPARYWEMMLKKLARENSRLMERCGELEDLLRWRDANNESPIEHADYLVQYLEFSGGGFARMVVPWSGSWPPYFASLKFSYWRPIGPLPGEGDER